MKQVQIKKPKTKSKKEELPAPKTNPAVVSEAKEVVKMADEMVDKIDDLLGEQAEVFIQSYRQKGGE